MAKRDEWITAYNYWKKAHAPLQHVRHLLRSPLVSEDAKDALRAEYQRLRAIAEPRQRAAQRIAAAQKADGTWLK